MPRRGGASLCRQHHLPPASWATCYIATSEGNLRRPACAHVQSIHFEQEQPIPSAHLSPIIGRSRRAAPPCGGVFVRARRLDAQRSGARVEAAVGSRSWSHRSSPADLWLPLCSASALPCYCRRKRSSGTGATARNGSRTSARSGDGTAGINAGTDGKAGGANASETEIVVTEIAVTGTALTGTALTVRGRRQQIIRTRLAHRRRSPRPQPRSWSWAMRT